MTHTTPTFSPLGRPAAWLAALSLGALACAAEPEPELSLERGDFESMHELYQLRFEACAVERDDASCEALDAAWTEALLVDELVDEGFRSACKADCDEGEDVVCEGDSCAAVDDEGCSSVNWPGKETFKFCGQGEPDDQLPIG